MLPYVSRNDLFAFLLPYFKVYPEIHVKFVNRDYFNEGHLQSAWQNSKLSSGKSG